MQAVNAKEFTKEVVEAKEVVLVDFWSKTCAPCKALKPIVQGIEKQFGDKLKVVTVDADEPGNENLGDIWGLFGLPTVLIFKDGEVVSRMMGVHPKDYIAAAIQKALDA